MDRHLVTLLVFPHFVSIAATFTCGGAYSGFLGQPSLCWGGGGAQDIDCGSSPSNIEDCKPLCSAVATCTIVNFDNNACYLSDHPFSSLRTGGTANSNFCTRTLSAGGQADPHMFGSNGDRFDFKGRNETVYNVFSTRHFAANVLFMHDTFHMGGTCPRCSTKTVHGSFMKEVFLNLTTDANTSVTVHFTALTPSTARLTSLLPGVDAKQSMELKVSQVLPGAKELTFDNVLVRLERIHTREVRLKVSNGKFEVVAKSRMYPYADQNQRKKRIDFTIASIGEEDHAAHGLVGQTFDKDDVAIDGALDDYTGTLVSGNDRIGHRVVTTQAMGEGAIEGVPEEYEIDRSAPFSTNFKFSRFDSLVAAPRNTKALTGKKRKIVKVKGAPAKASMEHDITDEMGVA